MIIRTGHRRIHYDLVGPTGGPIACFAHSLSSDSGIWSEQIAPLVTQGWQVLRLDMRGHGGSDPVAEDCSMSALAGDVVLVLDFLGIPQIHFVGVSIGGMIGQVLGIEHGPRLHSLMLCGTSPRTVPGGMAMWEARFATIRAASSVEPLADDTMGRWFTDGFKPRRPDRWKQVRETIAATPPTGYIGGANAILGFDVLSQLPAVKAPTLVLCGDGDVGTPPEGNRTVASLIPGARYHEMANARHIPMLEYPDAFNRVMLDWLAARR
jgi:3-oxoadipate enol-lactonase